jgi:hypothetical protein
MQLRFGTVADGAGAGLQTDEAALFQTMSVATESELNRHTGRPMPEVEGVRHRMVEVGEVELHLAEAGEGPPLLLLHGYPQHWYVWRQLISDLARDNHVMAPDLRGFGWSQAPREGYD